MKSLNEMEELKRFQGSTFDGFSRRKLVENRDTILELTAKIQELENEVNCMKDSRFFLKVLNQYAVDNHTLPVNQRGQGDGVPKAGAEQVAADSRGSRTCVCANTFWLGVAHAGREGWINIMPWYRPVGVAPTSSETQRRKSRAAPKRVSGRHVVRGRQSSPIPAQQPAVFRWQ